MMCDGIEIKPGNKSRLEMSNNFFDHGERIIAQNGLN